MATVSVVLLIPVDDEATQADAETLLAAIQQAGFCTDLLDAQRRTKPFVVMAGASLEGITDAVMRGKLGG
jgi:ribosomal protein S12 methylthiotransferase accessory factor YcaO